MKKATILTILGYTATFIVFSAVAWGLVQLYNSTQKSHAQLLRTPIEKLTTKHIGETNRISVINVAKSKDTMIRVKYEGPFTLEVSPLGTARSNQEWIGLDSIEVKPINLELNNLVKITAPGKNHKKTVVWQERLDVSHIKGEKMFVFK